MASKTKRFERKKKTVPDLPFTMVFEIDGENVDHTFIARPEFAYGDMVGMKKFQDDEEGAVLPILDRMIRRSLRNDDGVPARWKPVVREGEFTAPDGTSHPVADLVKFTAHEAGSSRRRWVELIESDDAFVDFDQVMGVFEFMAEEAGRRPTEK